MVSLAAMRSAASASRREPSGVDGARTSCIHAAARSALQREHLDRELARARRCNELRALLSAEALHKSVLGRCRLQFLVQVHRAVRCLCNFAAASGILTGCVAQANPRLLAAWLLLVTGAGSGGRQAAACKKQAEQTKARASVLRGPKKNQPLWSQSTCNTARNKNAAQTSNAGACPGMHAAGSTPSPQLSS